MERYISTFILLLAFLSALAVPARPGIITVTQPDGTTVNVSLVGDETHHYYLSEDGYLLLKRDGFFYYADADEEGKLIASPYLLSAKDTTPSLKAYLSTLDREAILEKMKVAKERLSRVKKGSLTTRGGSPGLFPYSTYPTKGEQRALVILVEFPDQPMILDNAHDYFTSLLNEPGFSEWGATGSARDYFLHCSSGQFSPDFDVYGPVTLPLHMGYYGGNDSDGNDRHPAQMVVDACKAIDDEVDFTRYDCDGDGVIDNVFVFYAGEGEAAGGSEDTIWPHSWYVTTAIAQAKKFDGVLLDRYACSCEWVVRNYDGRPDGVGTFIHEFSHVLGLPDLYATDQTNCFTPGTWSVLDRGSYNNNGCTPPAYSAFERYALGWLSPLELNKTMSVTLEPISSNQAGIFYTTDAEGNVNKDEYFLLENRQKTGWDAYIPGHGMLVWHVDYDDDTWFNNEVNNDDRHQHVDLVEADGITSNNKDRKNDAFPGGKNITGFSDLTRPSSKSWAGVPSGVAITDIAEKDGLITFKFNYSASAPAIAAETFGWKVFGSEVDMTGLPPMAPVAVYDMTGKVISTTTADADGKSKVIINTPGIYVVRVGDTAVKVII